MKSRLLTLLAALVLQASAADRPNVLFIAIDDQNDWVGCLDRNPQALTPNIDALAKRGTVFTNAHCQSPLCNPSRSSVLTGLRPSTTGIHGLSPGIRQVERTKDAVTLPQTFTKGGWETFTCGKIYHDGSIAPKDRPAEFKTWGPAPFQAVPENRFAKLPGNPIKVMDWGAFPERDEDTIDHQIASAAIQALKDSPADKPFFIACGFRLPHVPIFAPKKWFDLHPLDKLKLPDIQEDDRKDTPMFSWYLHWKLPEPRLSALRKTGEWKSLVRSYLAGTSFMDAQVGRLLAALQESGRADNTIVVLWSDHGWHLGEKLISGKNTLWDPSTHVPLVFAGPGVAKDAKCRQAVELLDIYPTLLDLTAQPARSELEGHSLLPQLKDASAKREWPAITSHNQGNHTIRTDRWRYIRYADGSEELYDELADPHEWKNLAADPSLASVRADLAKWLPKIDVPMAPGSKSRTLSYDPATHTAVWEGKVIDPAELEE
jgi:arylsulfatase A-like enzyme